MEIILPQNHILYSSADDVRQIISPLHECFGVTEFEYVQVNPDLSRVHLSINPTWNEVFYQNVAGYYEKGGFCEGYHWESGYSIWHMLDKHEAINEAECIRDCKEFNIGNALVINNHYQEKGYTEMAFFGFPPDASNMKIIQLLNNMDLLQKFIVYFKQQAAKIIETANQNPIVLPFLNHSNPIKDFSANDSHIKKLEQAITETTAISPLTTRELECIEYLLQGQSAKQTAKILNISPRTIDSHLAHIRQKLGCRNGTAVFRKVIELGILKIGT